MTPKTSKYDNFLPRSPRKVIATGDVKFNLTEYGKELASKNLTERRGENTQVSLSARPEQSEAVVTALKQTEGLNPSSVTPVNVVGRALMELKKLGSSVYQARRIALEVIAYARLLECRGEEADKERKQSLKDFCKQRRIDTEIINDKRLSLQSVTSERDLLQRKLDLQDKLLLETQEARDIAQANEGVLMRKLAEAKNGLSLIAVELEHNGGNYSPTYAAERAQAALQEIEGME